jgi:hypothetical protein
VVDEVVVVVGLVVVVVGEVVVVVDEVVVVVGLVVVVVGDVVVVDEVVVVEAVVVVGPVVVEPEVAVVMFRHQPPLMLVIARALSSTTYRFHVPLGLPPLNVESEVDPEWVGPLGKTSMGASSSSSFSSSTGR